MFLPGHGDPLKEIHSQEVTKLFGSLQRRGHHVQRRTTLQRPHSQVRVCDPMANERSADEIAVCAQEERIETAATVRRCVIGFLIKSIFCVTIFNEQDFIHICQN